RLRLQGSTTGIPADDRRPRTGTPARKRPQPGVLPPVRAYRAALSPVGIRHAVISSLARNSFRRLGRRGGWSDADPKYLRRAYMHSLATLITSICLAPES